MLLEKSSFHISKTSIQPNTSTDTTQKSNKVDENRDEKTFWSWFKGLINPLQNLPIISGIYSSLNSDNPESDRDLVQNSLGGFLYGGPIGAIAGFGTWAFNKIFDKTPTEFAFDFTGISNLWKKDKDESLKKTVAVDSKMVSPMQISKADKKTPSNKVKEEDINNLLEQRKELSFKNDKKPIESTKIIQKNKIVMDIPQIKRGYQEKVDENKHSFRKIEFNYPEWKPKLEVSKQTKHLSESEKDLYKSFIKKENDTKKNLLINIDA